MADVIYNSFKAYIMDGSIDLDTDTIDVMLVTSSYTPDQDTHEDKADVTNEVTGTGYTADGAALASKAVTIDDTDNEGVFDAADVTWSSSTITARGAVLYKDTGSDATSLLICYLDFGSDQSSSAGDFTISWNSEGILNLN
jgi:hypothetical protein